MDSIDNYSTFDTDPLYNTWAIPGDNPYNLSLGIAGQPSVFPRRVMYVGYVGNFYWNQPINVRIMEPIVNYHEFVAMAAPPVPHSGSVNDMHQSAPRPSRQNDVSLMNLKAPRF